MTGPTPRVAVVTGAASGIGAAIAEQLRRDGLHVAALDRDEVGNGGSFHENFPHPYTHTAARRGDQDLLAVPCDVRDDAQVAAAIGEVTSWRSRIDVVVNAAGVLVRADVRATTPETWQTVLDINLVGTFRVVQAAIPHLTATAEPDAKRVINIGSGAADRGYAYPAYTASKGGIVALTRQLAAELAPEGVTVNAINPGFIRTAMNDDAWRDDEARARWERTIPLGRMGRPEEVAAAASFLASPGAGYITGQAIRVDGGRSAISGRPT